MGEIEDEEDAEASLQAPPSLREEMLAALARYLSKKRLANITRMAAPGHERPKRHNGVVPDIEALTSMVGIPVFGVAEDCETFALSGSTARLDALSRVTNAETFLVVPRSCYPSATQLVREKFKGRDITVLPYSGKAQG